MPTPVKYKRNVGEQGLADVRVLKNSVRIVFKETEATYDIEKEDWNDERPGGLYNVTMAGGNKKILGLRPVSGSYVLRFKQFGNRVNDVPEPKIQRGGPRRGKDGKPWYAADRLIMQAVFEVESSDKKYNGLTGLSFVQYGFERYAETDVVQINSAQTEKFMRLCGFDFMRDEIPYSSNVLPWLERYLLAQNEALLGTIDDSGFVQLKSLSVLPKELAGKK